MRPGGSYDVKRAAATYKLASCWRAQDNLFSALAPLECMHSSLASATITDGVLTEEDVLRRSRAASLDTVRHLTIYGAGSEHRTSPEDRPSCTACTLSLTFRWSLRTTAPAMRGSARRIHRIPADTLRDALARRKPGTTCLHGMNTARTPAGRTWSGYTRRMCTGGHARAVCVMRRAHRALPA